MKFDFGNSKLKLSFEIDDNSKIKLVYFGNSKNFIAVPSNIVEIELSETNHLNKNPGKKCNTYFGQNSKYLKHEINGNELVILTCDDFVEVESHFILRDGIAGITTWNVVKNITNKQLHLEFIPSFYLYGINQKSGQTFKGMNLVYAKNGWNSECQWKNESFIDAGLFNTNNKINMNSFALTNNGSWSTKEFLPSIGIENEYENLFLFSHIEHNGSWNISVGDVANNYYLALSGPTFYDNSFMKILKSNEYFYSCRASIVLSKDFESSVQEITLLRRQIQKPSLDHQEMPIIFNDFMHGTWDLSTEELVKPMIDSAKEAGADVFVMDAGWFAEKSGWPDFIGEWKPYDANFPTNGLKGMFDYIHSLNMKAGLWFEIENIGEKCPILDKFSEDCFFHISGQRSKHAQRYALNFAKREVFVWAFDIVCRFIDEYNLDYIKLDYNVDVGIGNETDSDSIGEGLFKNNRAIIRWIKTLQDKYPHLTIENCASGGQRMDYEMLKVCPIQSSSDLEDYRLYPYISCNILAACPPEVGAIWSYPVCNDTSKFEITDEVVIANMVNSMLGRLHLASKLFKLSKEQFELVKEGVSLHKKLNEFKKKSVPIFPIGPAKFFANEVVAGLMDAEKIVLNIWNTSDNLNKIIVDLSKYGATNPRIIYPQENSAKFDFNEKTGLLVVELTKGHTGRTFEFMRKKEAL